MARENEVLHQGQGSAVARLLRLEGGLGRPAGRGALQGDDGYGAVLGVLVGDVETAARKEKRGASHIRLLHLDIDPVEM